ncbi:TPA: type I restriction enzyme HsdR N-terminal domain-containing protein [Clostridioides difficile]|uniref:type I restriction endonuclease n=1 Tax=Clostridioides difficile TaxID=1496 RepID=UPI00038C6D0C|nr:type I restriction endonuclease [Clostridioides difficile]EQJ93958.1 type I restriction enzyme R family protein [Clostridioides difficile P51]MDO0459768.1 type I restriction enzyme HsdR N-terminal domain-containing protein [Clostridioides difficile]HBF1697459.1 type I restriction enzyme HsdR N-terminal domain-containing protein [Clostridioides difficile]HBF3265479.1 type I restriction enzyme HsdR N-terminal domain-containing protein [Clostridioides difficile]HBG0928066.1 type I restriction 
MDFSDKIKQFSKRIEVIKGNLTTEEATKTALIMPFFQILEYDVFNPLEFMPEYTADVGVKRGEKVDYAILEDGKPIILIEAKNIKDKLTKHDAQLFRYFTATEARFAILTNGIIYKFFTDLEEKNKMDEKPFMTINLLDIDENKISHLKKFAKTTFDVDVVFNIASESKYTNLIKEQLNEQLESPSDEFVRFIINDFYNGVKTQNVVEKFRPIVKRSILQFATDFMNEKLKSLLESNDDEDEKEKKRVIDKKVKEETERKNKEKTEKEKMRKAEECQKEETKIDVVKEDQQQISAEEKEAFDIVQDILGDLSCKEDITYKKEKEWLNILYKSDSNLWICNIKLTSSDKLISLPNQNDEPTEYRMDEVIDIRELKDELNYVLSKYIN